jgi:galactose-1-phosphate uridylyltransferase
MISGVLGRFSRGKGDSFGINPNWIMDAAITEAETIRARIKLIEAVLGPALAGSRLEEEWKDISASLYKRAKDRNIIVHSEWAWSEHVPDKMLKINRGQSPDGWIEKDFLAAFDRIKALEDQLHHFMEKVLVEIDEGRVIFRNYVP